MNFRVNWSQFIVEDGLGRDTSACDFSNLVNLQFLELVGQIPTITTPPYVKSPTLCISTPLCQSHQEEQRMILPLMRAIGTTTTSAKHVESDLAQQKLLGLVGASQARDSPSPPEIPLRSGATTPATCGKTVPV